VAAGIIPAVPEMPVRLTEDGADPEPARQFDTWFAHAVASRMSQPEAAALATATPDGAPSVRMVLVKQVDARGFLLFTNYESRKGMELAANPRGALLFFWEPLGRQVRIEGSVERATREESDAYIRRRSRASQLSALASPQSQPVPSRHDLEHRVAELRQQYGDGELPMPSHWGGFRVVPERYEFWQHGDDRLHDRLVYLPTADGGWQIERLAP
jgi:pyridoxamine 5'-phosphate oxidase